jgi:serine protease DegQ
VAAVAVEQGSPAWGAGLREGDLVLGVNRLRVHSLRDLKEAIGASRGGLTLSLRRGGTTVYIVIR